MLVKLSSGVSPYIVLAVQNPTDHDIELAGRIVVGTLHKVQTVSSDHCSPVSDSQVNTGSDQATDTPWNPPINLSSGKK